MGLAAGGKMEQKIYPDPYGLDCWDQDNKVSTWVHIVDSMSYKEITGSDPPFSPISAQTYTEYGLPWFELYDEDKQTLEATEKLKRIKSVKEKDQEEFGQTLQDDSTIEVKSTVVIGLITLFILLIINSSWGKLVDITDESGLNFFHVDGRSGKKYLLETLGAGAAFFDYNQDGQIDLYLVNGANLPGSHVDPLPVNSLYHNNGDGTFTLVPSTLNDANYGFGVAVGDYDNDGDSDLYVTNFGPNKLYCNNGDGTFSDVTQTAGVVESRWSTSCAFLDADNDGYLDLFVVNYMQFTFEDHSWWETDGLRTYRSPADQIAGTVYVSQRDTLYHNNGNGTFTDVSLQSGIVNRGLGLSLAVGDFDNDGDHDIQVANDMERDFLYQNNGNGTFVELASLLGVGYDANGMPGSGMGSSFGDYDNDGDLDLVVSNASDFPVLLYRNDSGLFTDVSFSCGIGAPTLTRFTWGVDFLDANNDGLLDIYAANGHLQENIALISDQVYAQSDQLFLNQDNHRFSLIEIDSAIKIQPQVSRGVALGDYDNDGDLDFLFNNSNQPVRLLRNDYGQINRWIAFQLIGTDSNRSAIGATITLSSEGQRVRRTVTSGSGYLSQNDQRLFFGLGQKKMVQKIDVHWPSGTRQTFTQLQPNQFYRLVEGKSLSPIKL